MPKVFSLSEYQVLPFFMHHVDLELDLTKKPVHSKAILSMIPNPEAPIRSNDLLLDGQNMVLTSIALDDRPLALHEYELNEHSLLIKNVPQDRPFRVEMHAILGENTDLFGLYETEGTVLVKAETEGLRRVFYCVDRPDNLATYTTTIIADKRHYPVLLSNGILTERKIINNNIHSMTWVDELPKPSYLFAIVAGQLHYSTTSFITQSGRELAIDFYVPPAASNQCEFAKEVLKKAMRWDEVQFHLECDLKQHMVAGVDKYASGASEPTGLNLFNTANLYATAESTTDMGILRVMEVVAHEFFHYWSGDRVTIRDWFNLPFKEGLTTFRAAMFREQLFGTDLVRLLDGKNFDERAPRQSSYTAVRSLYTAAAYEKSADVFRMMMLTLGEELFYKSMTQFLLAFDGRAVTLEDMLDFLSEATQVDVHPFLSWFTESGIPLVQVTDHYDSRIKRYTLCVKTQGAKSRPIPLLFGLINPQGHEILGDTLLHVDQEEMEFHFDSIDSCPIPSLLRSFSAPVELKYAYSNVQLMALISHDSNQYNRVEAIRKLIYQLVQEYLSTHKISQRSELFATYRTVLNDTTLSPWMLAELLHFPTEEELIGAFPNPNFEQITKARTTLFKVIAQELRNELYNLYTYWQAQKDVTKPQFSIFDIQDAGKRRLLKICLQYLYMNDPRKIKSKVLAQFNESLGKNMTNTINALSILCDLDDADTTKALENYYAHWQHYPTAVNYWFAVQAGAHSTDSILRVRKLLQHPAFDLTNPNKVYSLFGAFIANPYGFHQLSGQGYQLVAETIITLDKINPSLAAKLAEAFVYWDKYDSSRHHLLLEQLVLLHEQATSIDVQAAVKKGLDKMQHTHPSLKTAIISDEPPKGH